MVIELNGEFLVKILQWQPLPEQDTDHVLQGTGNEAELLFEPQLFTLLGLIVGIEHFG